MSAKGLSGAGDSREVCTLLVSSCDGYSDLWRPYFNLIASYWPDCPFSKALITEALCPPLPGVSCLGLGRGRDWSSLLLDALSRIETPYVLFTLEDFFLRSAVDNNRMVRLLQDCLNDNLAMLRLVPRPGPDGLVAGKEYGEVPAGAPYRVSTQAAFWKREVLIKLLRAGESAWEFEVNGSARSAGCPGFFAVKKPALTYWHHVVERGKWFPWDYWRFRKLNIGVVEGVRSVMTATEAGLWLAGKAVSPIIASIPLSAKKRIRAWLG